MMKYFTLIVWCVLFQLSSTFAQKGIQFAAQENWNQVLVAAAKENKIIFIDGYTNWCQPCKRMDKQVFPQKLVGDFYNENFINVKVNMEEGIGKDLQKKYNVFFYPTFLFLTADGTLVHRIAGFQSAPKMLNLGKTAVNPDKRLAAFDERFANGDRDPKFLKRYTILKKESMDGKHDQIAVEYLKKK
ncbi:MAG: thioredoxin family protein [Bacteroidota bacterium]